MRICLLLIVASLISALDVLPSGNTGIAAGYPGDVGIAGAPGVVFADDFEGAATVAALQATWTAGVMHQVRVATEADLVHAGGRALEFTVPKQAGELSNQVMRHLSPKMDVVFMRYYTRFDPGFAVIGSSHNGCSISGGYYRADGSATPGIKPTGRDKFFVSTDSYREANAVPSPGAVNSYVYWPEQGSNYGDLFYGDGTVLPFSGTRSGAATFGAGFVSRPPAFPPLGTWICMEVMVRLNAVGKRDGRIATWMDGVLIADFPNLRFRDVDTVKADRIGLDLHIRSNTIRANKKWYDDVVVATGYIGPMAVASGNTAPDVSSVTAALHAQATQADLAAVATDDAGEAGLTYAWGAMGPAAVSFSANGSNAAKSSTAVFSKAGSYTITCTATDGSGLSGSRSTIVMVKPQLTALVVGPATANVAVDSTTAFTASGSDQFGDVLLVSPAWSVPAGGGSITSAGIYTAPSMVGSATVRAAAAGRSATASVTVLPGNAFTAQVNFQPATAPVPVGFIADSGALYGIRHGGTYGWNLDLSAPKYQRDRNEAGMPQEKDTHLLVGDLGRADATWEMAVPSGTYDVVVVMGDPRDAVMTAGNRYFCTVEGSTAIDGTATAAENFITGSVTAIAIHDGRLTLHFPGGAGLKNKVCFIAITAVGSGSAPAGRG